MSDPSFERQLGRMFADAPPLSDAAAFTASVQARLERGWTLRRVMIGSAGAVGGLLAATQMLQANLVQRASEASRTADARSHDLAAELTARGLALLHTYAPSASAEVLWMVAGLGAVGLALVGARLMERF